MPLPAKWNTFSSSIKWRKLSALYCRFNMTFSTVTAVWNANVHEIIPASISLIIGYLLHTFSVTRIVVWKRPCSDIMSSQSSQPPSSVRLPLSTQPHDQNSLPLATTELNLNLEHSQRKTINQPHGSQDLAHQLNAHYLRCYHTQIMFMLPWNVGQLMHRVRWLNREWLKWMVLLLHCGVSMFINKGVTGFKSC